MPLSDLYYICFIPGVILRIKEEVKEERLEDQIDYLLTKNGPASALKIVPLEASIIERDVDNQVCVNVTETQPSDSSNAWMNLNQTVGERCLAKAKGSLSRPFACPQCSYKAKTKYCLKDHELIHTREKRYSCHECPFKTTHLHFLNEHQLFTHSKPKHDNCKENIAVVKKQVTKTETKIKVDNFLNQLYSSISKTKRSAQAEDEPVKVGKRTRAKVNYPDDGKPAVNDRSTKDPDYQPPASYQSDSVHECENCSFTTTHLHSFLRHRLNHTSEKPFSCGKCSFRTAWEHCLIRHRLVHSDKKKYSCNACSYKTTHGSNLRKHQYVHSGIKPYSCEECPYKAVAKNEMRKHKVVHQK